MRQDKMRPCERCGVPVPAGKAVYRNRCEAGCSGERWVGTSYQMRLCAGCAQSPGRARDVVLVGMAFLMGLLVLFGVLGVVAR
jgi:hypothetical protein